MTKELAKTPELNWHRPTDKSGLEELGRAATGQLELALPKHLKGSGVALLRALFTEVAKTPALLDCTPLSLLGGVIQAGALGLRLGSTLGQAYLLPFGNKRQGVTEATLIIGYRGFIQLAHRSGQVARITPRVVYEGDEYSVRYGSEQRIDHTPRDQSNKPVAYYCLIKLVNGETDFDAWTVRQAEAWRDRYSMMRNADDFKKKSSPWYDYFAPDHPANGFNQMALKSLIRGIAKRTPLSTEMNAAAAVDDDGEHGREQQLGVDLLPDPLPEDDPARLLRELQSVPAGPADGGGPSLADGIFPEDGTPPKRGKR